MEGQLWLVRPGLIKSVGLLRKCQWLMEVACCAGLQLADWRTRPLTPEMLHYARCDTHFLLYVHDRLKQELVGAGDQVGFDAHWQTRTQKHHRLCMSKGV